MNRWGQAVKACEVLCICAAGFWRTSKHRTTQRRYANRDTERRDPVSCIGLCTNHLCTEAAHSSRSHWQAHLACTAAARPTLGTADNHINSAAAAGGSRQQPPVTHFVLKCF